MKRSRSVRLVLLGGFTAGALSGCSPSQDRSHLPAAGAVYTNNHHLPGVGYYHAPYRAWFALPYNNFDPARQQYFHGGQWTASPHQSVTNISEAAPEALRQAHQAVAGVRRGGFGSSAHRHGVYS